MASRLSEVSIKGNLSRGHRSLPWELEAPQQILPVLDLDDVLERADIAEYVPNLPPAQLYYSLVQRGLDESLEIMKHVSGEQLTRFLDYDVWREDRLQPKEAYRWLNLYRNLGIEQMAQRYRDLDEEYQISLLQGKVRTYDLEEIEQLPDHLRDQLIPLPCHELFYEIITDDKEDEEFITSLIDSALAQDLPYAYALLAYAAYSVPAEPEHELSRFRRARIEEDGFVTFEESLASFLPIDLDALHAKYPQREEQPTGALVTRQNAETNSWFLEEVKAYIHQSSIGANEAMNLELGFLYVANSLCAAEGLEPDDVHGIVRVLKQARALASLGLEYLAGGDPIRGTVILQAEHPKLLLQVGLSLVYKLQDTVLAQLARMDVDRVDDACAYRQQLRHGELLYLVETEWMPILGLELGEVLRGLFNRLPMRAKLNREKSRYTFEPMSSLQNLNEMALTISRLIEQARTVH